MKTPTLPERALAARSEALDAHNAYMLREPLCPDGYPVCAECRRLMKLADQAGDRWSLAMEGRR